MNLVSAQRSSQVALEGLEKEVSKLDDHVDDVDDHLRGVAGRESLDTRVVVLEREMKAHGNELMIYGGLLRELDKKISELKTDVHSLKFQKSMNKEIETGRLETMKEWLRFWGPIIIACLALIVPLATVVANHWSAFMFSMRDAEYKPDERLRKQIAADKKSARGRAVKNRLAALQRAATSYQP